jgi:hypothetical protein
MSRRAGTPRNYDFSTFPAPDSVLGQQYYYVTLRFWPSLVFVLPMLAIFEVGQYVNRSGSGAPHTQLVAAWLIQYMISAIGASGFYFPAPSLLVIAILLACHLVARQPWRFDIWVLAGMLGESLIYTIPLFILDRVTHAAFVAGTSPEFQTWRDQVIQSFGAGIYEELVFRFICMNVLHIALVDVCQLPRTATSVFIIFASAAIFAAFHHWPIGAEAFDPTVFMFRMVAGLYFAGLYFFRGFGIAAGCHSFYNVLVFTLQAVHH